MKTSDYEWKMRYCEIFFISLGGGKAVSQISGNISKRRKISCHSYVPIFRSVSRSGYYAHIERAKRPAFDQGLVDQIARCQIQVRKTTGIGAYICDWTSSVSTATRKPYFELCRNMVCFSKCAAANIGTWANIYTNIPIS